MMRHATSVQAVDPAPGVPVIPGMLEPPHRVDRPVMLQTWRDVAFLHWACDPELVARLIPDDLVVDTFDGAAWVGLVGFEMVGIRAPGLPPVPYLGTFPETNVRTYVRDRSGRPGVWFHSLDASHLAPVITARIGYRLPYVWSRMSIDREGHAIRYRSERKWPGPRGATGNFTIRPDRDPHRATSFEAFLTARWGLYTVGGRTGLRYAPVDHPAWPLHRAKAAGVSTDLLEAAGYPVPGTEPHVLWSPGVPVRVGLPRRVL